MSSWVWKITGAIYAEPDYFNLGEMEAAHGVRV